MPTTGERLAEQLGRDGFDPASLLEPETNLDLGAFYIAQLLSQMDGDLPAAVASYNAGPTAVRRWRKASPDLEQDVWIESIPYRETRRYVKRVLRSVQVYRALHPDLAVPRRDQQITSKSHHSSSHFPAASAGPTSVCLVRRP